MNGIISIARVVQININRKLDKRMINKIGPKMDPWETPNNIFR